MKRILLPLILLSVLTTYAQEPAVPVEPTDTVINIDNPSNIVLSETPDGIRLMVIEGEDSVTTYSYNHPDPDNVNISSIKGPSIDSGSGLVLSRWNKPNKTSFEMVSGGLSIGKNFAMGQPEPMDITTGKSWELSWVYMLGLRISRNGNSFITGIGFNWRNYRLTGPYQFAKSNGGISLTEYPEGSQGKWSRLKVTTLSVPVLYTRKIWKGLDITAGGIVNFATHSSIKTKFVYEGREIESSQNGIYTRPVTVDIYGAVTVCGLGWYVRYSPMKVIRGGHGPQFSTLSTGVVLGF